MLFLLDSNVFINAARLYYSPDIAPTFWGWLTEQNRLGRIASVSRVKDEIDDGEMGYLKKWSSELPNTFWLRPGVKAMDIDSMSRLADWSRIPERGRLLSCGSGAQHRSRCGDLRVACP